MRYVILYTMKSSTTPYEISNCPFCDDSGFDHAEDNFCECAEGDKLLRNEMKTSEDFETDMTDYSDGIEY